jgi:hypothetical protein
MGSPALIATLLDDCYVIVVFKPVDGTLKLTMGIVLIDWLPFDNENSWQDAT